MRTPFVAFALMLATLSSAFAAPVDLSGTWVLDRAASGDLDPLLKARGASWFERKAVASMDLTKKISQSGDTLTVEVITKAKSGSETVQVDGQARQKVTKDGHQATVTHTWEDRGWVSTSVVTPQPGVTVTATQTHSLSPDGATLTQQIRFVKGSDAPIEVDRIFRRQ
jgi:hypothetical protein